MEERLETSLVTESKNLLWDRGRNHCACGVEGNWTGLEESPRFTIQVPDQIGPYVELLM